MFSLHRVTQVMMACIVVMFSIFVEAEEPRPIYVISDLHFGVGSPLAPKIQENGPCPASIGVPAANPQGVTSKMRNTEDFRWPVAFCSFLNRIVLLNNTGVDLVIAGDFLELWQHPQVSCGDPASKDRECGCSVEQMQRVVSTVLGAHAVEFAALDRFLANRANRLIVIPGNHDAALMDDEIWPLIVAALPAAGDRLVRAESGTWMSPDRRIAIEHGHQQQVPDANAFPQWKNRRVTTVCEGQKRFFRPWGEHFVHELYTDVEMNIFPLIDNLVPDSAGFATYGAYAKVQGKTAEEWARFIAFNLLETSFYQKLQFLTAKERPLGRFSDKEVLACKACLGPDLILRGADPRSDLTPLLKRQGLEGSAEFRAELARQVDLLGMEESRMLCERIATLHRDGAVTTAEGKSCKGTLGTVTSKFLDPNGEHMRDRRVGELFRESKGNLEYYIFGHTHEAKVKMPVRLASRNVNAFNTGGFQRLIDKKHFDSHPKRNQGESDPEFLARITHEDLAACYPVVEVRYNGAYPNVELKQWYQEETGGDGKFLNGCDPSCTARPANC